MKLLVLPPVPPNLQAALDLVRDRGHDVSVADESELPSIETLGPRCDVMALDAERDPEWITALRQDDDCGSLLLAVWGSETTGRVALECGADLWIDPDEPGENLALRLLALCRRALLGGAPRLDSLTGLIGQNLFSQLLRHEFDRSSRYRRNVSVVVIEADQLEEINRELGFDIGDRALREMSTVLRGMVRDVDLLARISGKRFGIVFPETDAGGALTAAERLRAAQEANLFSAAASGTRRRGSRPQRMTVSIGIAAFPARGINRAEDLLGRALESLVQAQRRGGNRVVAFGASDVIWSREAPDPSQF